MVHYHQLLKMLSKVYKLYSHLFHCDNLKVKDQLIVFQGKCKRRNSMLRTQKSQPKPLIQSKNSPPTEKCTFRKSILSKHQIMKDVFPVSETLTQALQEIAPKAFEKVGKNSPHTTTHIIRTHIGLQK
jgi:hypothetical protein